MTHRIVVGLGWGDEAKGATVDWLCATEDVTAVVRFNGGPQAAHNVVLPDGRHHTFAQWGSGTLQGVPTYLSEYMLVDPLAIATEAQHLIDIGVEDPFSMLYVNDKCMVVTPYHVTRNRELELERGGQAHGSCGMGVGVAMDYYLTYLSGILTVEDLLYPDFAGDILAMMKQRLCPDHPQDPHELAQQYYDLIVHEGLQMRSGLFLNSLMDRGVCVFEGAQGVLLDELYGFNPHTTWSTCTQDNARALLDGREAECIGVTRAYHTRHGAGPFPSELHGGAADRLLALEEHNASDGFQGAWRVGDLDLSLLRYAVTANNGVDKLMVTHMDAFQDHLPRFTAGYNRRDGDLLHGWLFYLDTLSLPLLLEESLQLCRDLREAEPGPYIPLGLDFPCTAETLVEQALQLVVGVRPWAYSYGKTWQDRVVREEARA